MPVFFPADLIAGILIIGRRQIALVTGALLRFGGVMDSVIVFSAMGGDAMRLTAR
jgi:hypothetical protein